ncbi:MAG: exonuclease domain-containing protein [Elainella sp.]
MQAASDFIVVDTEGTTLLREIAAIDSRGRVVQQAFVKEHPEHGFSQVNVKPLGEILRQFSELAQPCRVVCHHAEHDRRVLQRAFQSAKLAWKPLRFVCTVQLAKRYFPDLPSYSLEYLSKRLGLQVGQKYFDPQQAHSALYDAEFTYQLYRKILDMQQLESVPVQQPNPFSSSRVDTPFQDYPDQPQVYQAEFSRLKAALIEIRSDRNHQSQGAVVIGEPGSGKTHLMMRLAKELLQVNRLLFVRQPNNPDSVLYHIYSRILDSFIQRVPENNFTQLENLLAHSFVKLISTSQSKNDQAIVEAVRDRPLNLYRMAAEDTDRKRAIWQHIERRTQDWWAKNYGFAGLAPQIIKGVIKFCSYSDPNRKSIVSRWLAANELDAAELERVGLPQWQEDTDKEAFSLEAISVFSRLSLLDEPLIIVFDQLESLGEAHNQRLLYNFGEAVKEIFTHVPNSLIIWNLFPDRWRQFQQTLDASVIERISPLQLNLPRPSPESLRAILQTRARTVGLEFEQIFTEAQQAKILRQPSIRAAINLASRLFQRDPESPTEPLHPEPSLEQRLSSLEAKFDAVQQLLGQLATAFGAVQFPGAEASRSSPTASPHPVSTYLQTQRQLLRQEYSHLQIITDSDDLGKLITIAEAFKTLQPFETSQIQMGKSRLPEHLLFLGRSNVAVGFLQIDGAAFTRRLQNWNRMLVARPDVSFQLWRDLRLPEISGKVGREEIEKLNHAPTGQFTLMDEDQRLDFELIYRLIVAIQNRDLDSDLPTALQIVQRDLTASWICQLLQKLR